MGVMFKGLGITLIVFIFIISWVDTVYTANLLWRITHEDQDVLIVGEITQQKDDIITISVIHIISGSIDDRLIKINSNFKYRYLKTTPDVGDVCVLSLNKTLFEYEIKWGAYKVLEGTQSELNKIKLVKDKLPENVKANLTALEYYINSGGKKNDFSFKYYKGINKVEVYCKDEIIYPEENKYTAVHEILVNEIKKINNLETQKVIKSFYIQLIQLYKYIKPKDPMDAVKLWAKGIKNRSGALQFAAFAPDLKIETYTKFQKIGWTTGVSSPWVNNYHIEKIKSGKEVVIFKVKFYMETSTGRAGSHEARVEVKRINDYWYVSNIESETEYFFFKL